MSDAPLLSATDIAAELRLIHATPHTLLTTALYGTGESDVVTVQHPESGHTLRFRVAPVTCELAFYEALEAGPVRPPRPAGTPPADGEEALVILVDYAMELPEDLCARVSGRRLFFSDRKRLLGRKFAASTVSMDLDQQTALCRALLEDPAECFAPTAGTTVSLAHALRALLLLHAGYPMDWALSLERLVEFAARSDRYPAFAAYLERRPEVRESLKTFLHKALGPLGPVVLRAWLQGLGRRVAALVFLLDGAGAELWDQPFLRAALVQALRGIEPELDKVVLGEPGQRSGNLSRLQEIARTLYLVLGDPLPGVGEAQWQREPPQRALDAVLAEAERLVADRDREAVAGLVKSPYLLQAFRRTRMELAEALRAFLAQPTQAGFAAAEALFRRLAQHRQAERAQERALLEQAEMALRLCAYLLERPNFSGAAELGAPYEELVLLAQHYAEEGGFVDHARRVARGRARSDDELETAIAQVVATIDAQRDSDDERFAQGLGAWLDARRPSDALWPIEQVLDKVAVPFLHGTKRKLLVLVLDGMAWHSAVELLLDLEQRERGAFAPLRYRPPRAGARGLCPPVLAGLPTMTSVSRAALLGGRTPRAGDAENTSLDKTRFADHKGLYAVTGEVPVLLLRGELETESGTIRQSALDTLASAQRVVGVVVNAIDDQLHGSRQVRVRYGLETIKMLPDLLQAAAAAERAVLVVSDHGHVSGARLSYVGRRGTGGRWRELPDDEAPREGEIALGQEGVWRPRRTGRVALLYRETETFRTAVGEGEHGGACLAEVVAPVLLLGAADLATRHGGDAELETVAFPRPGWWELQPRGRTARPKVVRAVEASPQLALLPELAWKTKVEDVKVVAPPSEWRTLLAGSKALRGAPRATLDRIILGVEGLAEHDGRLGLDLFARRVELPPGRAASFVSEMGQWLNLADETAVWLDRQGRQVVLRLDVLKSLFGEG